MNFDAAQNFIYYHQQRLGACESGCLLGQQRIINDGSKLPGIYSVAVSPDNISVYASIHATSVDHDLIEWTRDPDTGSLTNMVIYATPYHLLRIHAYVLSDRYHTTPD